VFLFDRTAGTVTLVSRNSAGDGANYASGHPVLSADGSVLAFESYASNLVLGDANGLMDVFLYARTAGNITLVSRNSTGTGSGDYESYDPAISADGKFVAFVSRAGNLVPGHDTW